MFINDDSTEKSYVEFICDCCGKSTKVIGTMNSPLSYFYLVAHNRGFYVYPQDITLCPHCNKVLKAINRKD